MTRLHPFGRSVMISVDERYLPLFAADTAIEPPPIHHDIYS